MQQEMGASSGIITSDFGGNAIESFNISEGFLEAVIEH